ncbi:hypothetical protein AXG93_669s1020 [Marchantia polymorpha subsp. ruderalis]|uniref:Uncharacterized protein n=1 Tax=Marchantia polymorpha subsp. ruderalis TaxID=1480154 RepID=A0A176WAB3_MARPO|nr:hypothetical protein AXG93_669s1020 [Marchantia polymorpha subsp. ruderalis]
MAMEQGVLPCDNGDVKFQWMDGCPCGFPLRRQVMEDGDHRADPWGVLTCPLLFHQRLSEALLSPRDPAPHNFHLPPATTLLSLGDKTLDPT